MIASALADDVGGMRAPVETTIGPVTPTVLFWIVLGLLAVAIMVSNYRAGPRETVERVLLFLVLVLLGAKVFGVPW